jgi:hypothetical protein
MGSTKLPFSYKEKTMMIFKPMALAEAKEFYEKLKAETPSTIVKIAMEDIWFFTNGLQKNYGEVK